LLNPTEQIFYRIGLIETKNGVLAVLTINTLLPCSSGTAAVKRMAAKGGLMVKNIEQGVYSVEVSKFGYQTQTLFIAVAADEPYNLTVKLTKN
jgi:hypothetical protein